MHLIKQQAARDCGLSVVAMMAEHYFKTKVNLTALAHQAQYGVAGLSIYELKNLAFTQQLHLEAFSAPLQEVGRLIGLNCYGIILMQNDVGAHYVIVKVLTSQRVRLYDPLGEVKTVKLSELKVAYQNYLMLVTPLIKRFTKSAKTPNEVTTYLVNYYEVLIVLFLSLFISALTLTSAALMKLVFDLVLPYNLAKLLTLIAITFSCTLLARALLNFLRSTLSRRIEVRAELILMLRLKKAALAAQMSSINKLTFDDYLQRFNLVSIVSQFAAMRALVLGQELIILVISGAMLIIINSSLVIYVVLGAVLLILVTLISYYINNEVQAPLINGMQQLLSSWVDFSRHLTISTSARQNSVEHKLDEHWSSLKSLENKTHWKLALGQMATSIIEQVVPLIVTILATKQVLANTLSTGAMLLFLSTVQLFLTPLITLVRFSLQLPQFREAKALLNFILTMPPRDLALPQVVPHIKKLTLTNLQVKRDLTLLTITHLEIARSAHLHGPNGIGKSTLLKYLAGDFDSYGALKINDVNYEKQTSVILATQTLYLSGQLELPNAPSILAYVVDQDGQKLERFMQAMRALNLEALLRSIKLHLQLPIANNGFNFSAGQRQVIILLRLFSEAYDIAFLDEVADNVDYEVFKTLQTHVQNYLPSLFVEVSHTGRFLKEGTKINLAPFSRF